MVGRRLFSWLLDVPTPPEPLEPRAPARVVVELVPVYSNGATGALTRLELEDDNDLGDVRVPPDVVAFRVAVTRRPEIYAGGTIAADPERMPPAGYVGPR